MRPVVPLHAQGHPTGKFGTAQEVANGVVFISSPMASRISGTTRDRRRSHVAV